MVVLVALVPCYIFIAESVRGRPLHAPVVALDRALPLVPSWAIVYGALYGFLIALPVFVVRQPEHVRRTVFAFLTIWIAAYVCFLLYPTVAPRPSRVAGSGFGAWGLRLLYAADPPYNCFPSLHVAHSFVSALTCRRVNRRVGTGALGAACLVALSTLLTKQHYVADVMAGLGLAGVAYVIFLRCGGPDEAHERSLAPVFALGLAAVVGIGTAGFWLAYVLSGAR